MDSDKKAPTLLGTLGNVEPVVVDAADENSTARLRLADAEAWRRENPHLWALIEGWALAEVDMGREFSMRELVERMRWHADSLTDKGGSSPRVSNDLAVVGARWLVREHPRCKEHLTMRRSAIDNVMDGGTKC